MLRVMTLNLWSRWGDWPARAVEVGAWLRLLEPDVVLLQEVVRMVDGTTTSDEVGQASGLQWHGVFGGAGVPTVLRRSVDEVSWGCAVLSRRPIDHHEIVPLPTDDPAAPIHQVVVHARTGGVDVFSAHLEASPRKVLLRRRQAVFLDQLVRARSDPAAAMPAVFGGDFNTDHDSDEVRFLSGLTTIDGHETSWQEVWRVTNPALPGWTWDNRNPNARTLNVAGRRIDFLFVGHSFLRPGGAGFVDAARLACDRTITGAFASDHLAVVADITTPDPAAAVGP